MRVTYDLRVERDRLQMGRDLGRIIEHWADEGDHVVPQGPAWLALEELRRSLEQSFLDQMSDHSQAGALARLFGRLTGTQPKPVPLGAEDYARLQGQREGMTAMLSSIQRYVYAAIEHDQSSERKAKPQPTMAQRPLGRSPM